MSGPLSGANGLDVGANGTPAGDVILSGSDTYSGSTTVNSGTLSLSQASLTAAAAVSIASGANLNLGFSGSDVVGSVYLNGVLQDSGTFGAGNDPAYFSGIGQLKVFAVPRTWNVSASWFGDWNVASNWIGNYVPNGVGKIATFDNTVAGPTTALTNVPVTLGVLNIASSSRIDITGGNQDALTMQADPTNPATGGTAQINISGGTITNINLPLTFNSPTAINVAAGSTLEISNPVNLNGQAVTKTGSGVLQLDVNFSASGGTLQVEAGAVAIGTEAVVSPALLDVAGNAILSGSGTIHGALSYESSAASRFAGNIIGEGDSLVLNARGGSLTLAGDDTYNGGTEVMAGKLDLASSTALLAGTRLTVVRGRITAPRHFAAFGPAGRRRATGAGAGNAAVARGRRLRRSRISNSRRSALKNNSHCKQDKLKQFRGCDCTPVHNVAARQFWEHRLEAGSGDAIARPFTTSRGASSGSTAWKQFRGCDSTPVYGRFRRRRY